MKIQVDVVSDVVCPWCFIGKRRLEQALAALREGRPELEVAVLWHPFQLNPETPAEGDPYFPYLERKFGGAEQVRRIWERVREAGAGSGTDFRFEDIVLRPNTLRAHRLIYRAQKLGKDADALVERLFTGHFQLAEDIGDLEALARIASEMVEDQEAVAAYLASDEDADEVLEEIELAGQLGISGVPFFIIDQRLGVSGAQPPETLVQAIEEALNSRT